jgi:hypothetical protein
MEAAKQKLYKKINILSVNRGTYDPIPRNICGQGPGGPIILLSYV